MTHHTSDSWPIYGVTCSISIKHITALSPGTSPYNWGKIWTNHLLRLCTGKGGGGWFSCQRENNRSTAHTHQTLFRSKWRTYSHPLRQTHIVICALCILCVLNIHTLYMHVCMSLRTVSTPQASNPVLMASMCCVSVVRITFSMVEEGQPGTVASPKMSPSAKSHHRKRNHKPFS